MEPEGVKSMKPLRLLLSTPPMVQINTPYPATAYLVGFLQSTYKKEELQVSQSDLGIELICRLFSKSGLKRMKKSLKKKTPNINFFLSAYDDYEQGVEKAMAYF